MFKKSAPLLAALALTLTLGSVFAAEDRRRDDAPPPPRHERDRGPRDGRPGPRDGRPGPRDGRPGPRHWEKGPRHDFGMLKGHGMFGPRFMDELELTPEQKTQMVDAMTANFREGLLARMEMADAHKALRDARDAETPDPAAIIAANEALGTAKGKMDALGIKAKQQFDSILTPEQRDRLEEWKDRGPRGDRDVDDDEFGPRGPRHGRHGPGPRGPKGCW